jgi:predicted lipid-binding transport protein (Tim44 family)
MLENRSLRRKIDVSVTLPSTFGGRLIAGLVTVLLLLLALFFFAIFLAVAGVLLLGILLRWWWITRWVRTRNTIILSDQVTKAGDDDLRPTSKSK